MRRNRIESLTSKYRHSVICMGRRSLSEAVAARYDQTKFDLSFSPFIVRSSTPDYVGLRWRMLDPSSSPSATINLFIFCCAQLSQ
jgi:hypothetical protein